MTTIKIQKWLPNSELDRLNALPEIVSRNTHAKKISGLSIDEIVRENTNLMPKEMSSFVSEVMKSVGLQVKGIGVELGAGSAGLSRTFIQNNKSSIELIYGVEIVSGVVEHLQTKVAMDVKPKLTPVVGSFDDLKLEDNSVDFIIELDSLHHSNNLDITLKEAFRVLKPGGKLIAFDRVQFNALTNAQVKFMLDRVYPVSFLEQYDLPTNMILTRRENGEHEITEDQWKKAISGAGFRLLEMLHFHRRSWKNLFYILVSQIPFKIRQKINKYPMLVKYPVSALLFYFLPKNLHPILGLKFRAFDTKFAFRGAFFQKTVLLLQKPKSS